MTDYRHLLKHEMQLSDEFLKQHEAVIREKLKAAAGDMARESSDIFAINQCLHLASSIILWNTTHLNRTLDAIKALPGMPKDKDPATILTIVTLYYLLEREAKLLEREAKTHSDAESRVRLDRIRRRFAEMNWMIGPQAMEALGLGRAKD